MEKCKAIPICLRVISLVHQTMPSHAVWPPSSSTLVTWLVLNQEILFLVTVGALIMLKIRQIETKWKPHPQIYKSPVQAPFSTHIFSIFSCAVADLEIWMGGGVQYAIKARLLGGVWGHAPQGKFWISDLLRSFLVYSSGEIPKGRWPTTKSKCCVWRPQN